MANTVFIMGAGASYSAGVPLMNDFLDEARKLHANNQIQDEDKVHFERVFKGISALQATHSKSSLDMYNLESVFATFEMAKRLNKMPNFEPDEIDELLHSMKRLIVVTIERKLEIPLNKREPSLPKPYFEFGNLIQNINNKLSPEEEVSILTFNYDIALDFMLSDFSLGPDYCLISSMKYGKRKVVKLLKLHGSINWGISEMELKEKQETIRNIRPYRIDEYKRDKFFSLNNSTTNFRIGSELKNYKEVKYLEDPVIVPPTWNKSTIHKDMLHVWREASKQLEKAENIFIIGFSMPETDIFFKHLYSLGTVGEVPLNRFWVFNPDDSGDTEKRYRDMLGKGVESRFEYKHEKFFEAIQTLSKLY